MTLITNRNLSVYPGPSARVPGRRLVLFLAILALAGQAVAATSGLERILEEFKRPDGTQVLVAAHRGMAGLSTGAWKQFPENSLAGMAHTIALGVDIIEVDVQKTKDGHLVIMHDTTLRRTTDGTNRVSELTLAEIKQLHLKLGFGGTNALTEHRVPTLEEVMLLAKGKCMVNLDKSWSTISECREVLKKTGTTGQAIFKSSYSASRCQQDYANLNPPVLFMPIIEHKRNWTNLQFQGWAQIEPYLQLTRPCAVELVFASDEDPIVAPATLLKMKQGGARPWINTMWASLDAGHTDEESLKDPATGWGWAIARGANILQTDESERLLDYLRSRKLHW